MATNTEPPKTASARQPEERSFETVMDRLEELVEKMEAEKMPLEELLVSYEEGVKLVKICSEKLDAAEKRIEIITRQASGKPKAVEFEPAAKHPGSQNPSSPQSAPAARADVSLF